MPRVSFFFNYFYKQKVLSLLSILILLWFCFDTLFKFMLYTRSLLSLRWPNVETLRSCCPLRVLLELLTLVTRLSWYFFGAIDSSRHFSRVATDAVSPKFTAGEDSRAVQQDFLWPGHVGFQSMTMELPSLVLWIFHLLRYVYRKCWSLHGGWSSRM